MTSFRSEVPSPVRPSDGGVRGGPITPEMVSKLLDDRPDDGIFRVDRTVFTDRDIFERELTHVFEGTWVFVGLESQLRKPNDFVTTYIGRHPVLITKDGTGEIRCFFNTCRHRGAIVCPFKKGNQKFHVCRYHGWSYDSAGKNVSMTDEKDGQYPPSFLADDHGLKPVPKIASYRGLLFASVSPDVPTLEEHLGDARAFVDLVVDQGVEGLEFVDGNVSYTFDANWKLQFENGLDYYHFASTHSSYIDVLKKREVRRGPLEVKPWNPTETDPDAQGSFSLARGHAMMWSIHASRVYKLRPLNQDGKLLSTVQGQTREDKLRWMFRQRNLTIYPNLQIVDIGTLQLRTWRPLAPDKTEITSHCLAPIGESDEARRVRIRLYEDFFNPSGLATSDDNVMYELCQTGYGARFAGPTQGYARGLRPKSGEALNYSSELQVSPDRWTYGAPLFGDETCFHSGYREWLRLMTRDPSEG